MRWTVLLLSLFVFPCAGLAQQPSSKPAAHCTEWKAWHNLQPGTTPPALHVTATCQFPTAGYSVELVPAKNKPKNANVLALRMEVHKPEGMVAQMITDVPLQYTLETKHKYSTVVIRPGKIRLKVEKVH